MRNVLLPGSFAVMWVNTRSVIPAQKSGRRGEALKRRRAQREEWEEDKEEGCGGVGVGRAHAKVGAEAVASSQITPEAEVRQNTRRMSRRAGEKATEFGARHRRGRCRAGRARCRGGGGMSR